LNSVTKANLLENQSNQDPKCYMTIFLIPK